MKKFSYIVNRFAGGQVRFCKSMLVGLGISMTLLILVQVFFRYVVDQSISWSEEAARYMMIWMGSLGAVVALRQGRHIGVRVLVERLPKKSYEAFVLPLVQLIIGGFLCILFWQGLELAVLNHDQLSPALELPMCFPYAAVPIGALLMLIDLFADVLERRWPTPAGVKSEIAAATLDATQAPGACQTMEAGK
jgi:C4-dicarboxylate transporter DctQ subunit